MKYKIKKLNRFFFTLVMTDNIMSDSHLGENIN